MTAPDAGVVVTSTPPAWSSRRGRADGWFEMLVAIGDFVAAGRPAGSVARRRVAGPSRRSATLVLLDNERSHVGDAAYGLRKLVDIAERSIASSPYDDPMTAVQAIDRIHDGLRQLCFRRMPTVATTMPTGVLRLTTRELAWHGYVDAGLRGARRLGSSSPVVARRLLAALDDLISCRPGRAPSSRWNGSGSD